MLHLRFSIVLLTICFSSCQANTQIEETNDAEVTIQKKINGLSFVASRQPFEKIELERLKKTHANHLAIMPFGFMSTLKSSELSFDHPRQWWGEQTEGCTETIAACKKNGFQIMLKPQIWIGGGDFTGFIDMESEKEWLVFEKNYTKFILHFAEIAEKEKVEIYCIGTELGNFVAKRPEFWNTLISDVRKVYSGKLTYAENWDCFDQPKFLKELDYIGVDAYFPLDDSKNPSLEVIKAGWKPHIEKLKKCSEEHKKLILFTECGYRSIDYAGFKPWDFGKKEASVNQELQSRLLQVMFELWDEEWMAGGYIWKWFPHHERAGGAKDDQFTPQNKLAERTIIDFYGKK